MKKVYLKPILKDHKLHPATILAGSDLQESQKEVETEEENVLSKGGFWDDSWSSDLEK